MAAAMAMLAMATDAAGDFRPLSAASSVEAAVRGRVYATVAPMHRTVEERVLPALDALADRVARDGRQIRLDNVAGFTADDKFLPGKLAIGLAYPLLNGPHDGPVFERRLADYRRLMDDTVNDPNETWGIYYYLLAIYKLREAGLLDRAISPATLAQLKAKLDWRRFVRTDTFALIDLPNNYYGVAFSAARLRCLLGWEDESASRTLLSRTLDHYQRYSGAYGFADETDGQGRFDRYSVLLSGEIAQRFIETGLAPPPQVRTWLRASVDLLLPRLNLRGEGFEYGRSIGPYGDTAFLEVLSAAAKLRLLTPREQRLAYAFSSRIAARYMDFWYDPAMQSVNMWRGGRTTDDYRAEHRILGENLSLFRQLIYTDAIWTGLGYGKAAPARDYAAQIARLPRSTLTWFARGSFDRAVVTIRDGQRVIGLPLINGGPAYHRRNAYFPAPFSPGLVAGAPDQTWPNLVPRIALADGTVLMPLAFFRDIAVKTVGTKTTVTLRQDALDDVNGDAPKADPRVTIRTRFVFTPGRMERTDVVQPTADVHIRAVSTEFGSFGHLRRSTNGFASSGGVRRFTASGYGDCAPVKVGDNPVYRTTTGALQTSIRCDRQIAGGGGGSDRLTLRWAIDYRQ